MSVEVNTCILNVFAALSIHVLTSTLTVILGLLRQLRFTKSNLNLLIRKLLSTSVISKELNQLPYFCIIMNWNETKLLSQPSC